jgi:hypothetical protein
MRQSLCSIERHDARHVPDSRDAKSELTNVKTQCATYCDSPAVGWNLTVGTRVSLMEPAYGPLAALNIVRPRMSRTTKMIMKT